MTDEEIINRRKMRQKILETCDQLLWALDGNIDEAALILSRRMRNDCGLSAALIEVTPAILLDAICRDAVKSATDY